MSNPAKILKTMGFPGGKVGFESKTIFLPLGHDIPGQYFPMRFPSKNVPRDFLCDVGVTPESQAPVLAPEHTTSTCHVKVSMLL